MSLFGSLMGDVEDDPFFGSHMRHMRQMSNMMSSMFADPFGMMGGGPLAIGGPRGLAGAGNSLMPFMPPMPSLDRLFTNLENDMANGSSYSRQMVVMSSGSNGKPQVYSSTSSTKLGPNGVKETKKTVQDSRTGTKMMSIGHHIGERAHVIEREQNVYSGDAEERQEFINIEEEEADDFNREFQMKAGAATGRGSRPCLTAARRSPPEPRLLALPPAPSTNKSSDTSPRRHSSHRPASRRPLRSSATTPSTSTSVRELYGGSHPQRHRHKHHKSSHRHSPAEN